MTLGTEAAIRMREVERVTKEVQDRASHNLDERMKFEIAEAQRHEAHILKQEEKAAQRRLDKVKTAQELEGQHDEMQAASRARQLKVAQERLRREEVALGLEPSTA